MTTTFGDPNVLLPKNEKKKIINPHMLQPSRLTISCIEVKFHYNHLILY